MLLQLLIGGMRFRILLVHPVWMAFTEVCLQSFYPGLRGKDRLEGLLLLALFEKNFSTLAISLHGS